jgi:hypothetical protein
VALGKLKDGRIRASTDTLAKSLRGDWRAEHLFTLKQTHALWQQHQTLISECDAQIEQMFQTSDTRADEKAAPLAPAPGGWGFRGPSAKSKRQADRLRGNGLEKLDGPAP